MRKKSLLILSAIGMFVFFGMCRSGQQADLPSGDPDNGGLTLPDGFEALVVADSIRGAARHLAVNDNGDIYVKLRFVQEDGGNAALRDLDGDGRADSVKLFGEYEDKGVYGTEMRIHNGYLWYSSVTRVFRQKLEPGKLIPTTPMELMVTDTQPPRAHDTKPVAFDNEGNMYIPFGAPSDCCQVHGGVPFSPGIYPCPMLEQRGGIWKFDANKPNQFQSDGERFATGIRSIVTVAWNQQDNNLFTLMHGRDYLHWMWPDYYSEWDGAVLPSEEFLRLKQGDNVGWPYAYYDHLKGKMIQNPEYGGDGKMEAKDTSYVLPVVGFMGHFAPNDLLFYSGDQFPERYKNGAFIAFHGSTSSAPYNQSGYFVAFVPFKNGSPSGPWEVFANGFAGVDTIHTTPDARYRPMGLAQGPDGSLYISDSEKGRIWRVIYKGSKKGFGEKNLAKMEDVKANALNIKTPDSLKDNLDKKVYTSAGKLYNSYCAFCHGRDGNGSGRVPPLQGSEWIAKNKELPITVVLNGMEQEVVVRGRKFMNIMPSLKSLSNEQVAEILTYVRSEFNNIPEPVTPKDVADVRSQLEASAKK